MDPAVRGAACPPSPPCSHGHECGKGSLTRPRRHDSLGGGLWVSRVPVGTDRRCRDGRDRCRRACGLAAGLHSPDDTGSGKHRHEVQHGARLHPLRGRSSPAAGASRVGGLPFTSLRSHRVGGRPDLAVGAPDRSQDRYRRVFREGHQCRHHPEGRPDGPSLGDRIPFRRGRGVADGLCSREICLPLARLVPLDHRFTGGAADLQQRHGVHREYLQRILTQAFRDLLERIGSLGRALHSACRGDPLSCLVRGRGCMGSHALDHCRACADDGPASRYRHALGAKHKRVDREHPIRGELRHPDRLAVETAG